ncbi:hypothetical protein M9Y10_045285 [Tritrichomonas musculus]|uniref:Uncharacterized protein n=1 Tax=Tritrichomonas musculus TaxID=1915356 RepID=A0ABR2JVJ2_9EUKA
MAKNNQKKLSIPELISKFLRKGERWDKKTLSLSVYWVKLILSIILGCVLGALKIQGATGNLIYILVPALMQFYVSGYLGVDIEDVLENGSGVFVEGMIPCFSAFLLCWSFVTTISYEPKL